MRISDGSSDGCSSDLLTLVFGVAGYLLRCYNFSPAPLLIGFVLSPMLEENFRRAMIMGRGEASYFFSSAISGTVLALTLVLLFLMLFRRPLRRLTAKLAAQGAGGSKEAGPRNAVEGTLGEERDD